MPLTTPSAVRTGSRSPQPTRSVSKRNRRRDSVTDTTEAFIRNLESAVANLRILWDKCGMEEEQRRDRLNTFYMHLQNLVSEMHNEEDTMVRELESKVEKFEKSVKALRKELGLEEFTVSDNLTLIQMEGALRQEAEVLRRRKKEHLEQLHELVEEDVRYCHQLDESPYEISRKEVPTQQQIDAIKSHIHKAKELLNRRKKQLSEIVSSLNVWVRKVDYAPRNSVERVLLSEPESFVYSHDNIKVAEAVFAEVGALHKEYLRQVREKIDNVKSELEIWWDRCHASEEQRGTVPDLREDNCTEDLLQWYRQEASKWQEYYEARRAVLSKVEEWESLWEEKIRHEVSQNDPSRYKNRGAALARELDRARNVEVRLLPHAEHEIKRAYKEWMDQQGIDAEPLLVSGKSPLEYLEERKSDYRQQRELEKQEKALAKKRTLENETRFGTTPGKRKGVFQLGVGDGAMSGRISPAKQRTPGNNRKRVGQPIAPGSPQVLGKAIAKSAANIGEAGAAKRLKPAVATASTRNLRAPQLQVQAQALRTPPLTRKRSPSPIDPALIGESKIPVTRYGDCEPNRRPERAQPLAHMQAGPSKAPAPRIQIDSAISTLSTVHPSYEAFTDELHAKGTEDGTPRLQSSFIFSDNNGQNRG